MPKNDVQLIMQKLSSLFDAPQGAEEEHKQAILKTLVERGLDVEGLVISELHVIDCIGSNIDPNVTFIANSVGLTKSAISKISTKLLQRKMIQTYKKENNKKEVLYSLTSDGRVVYQFHKKLHESYERKLQKVLKNFQPSEIKIIIKFIDALVREF